jgi:hypothetical protein
LGDESKVELEPEGDQLKVDPESYVHEDYSEEDFKKDSRAVCAMNDTGMGVVLWYGGAWIDTEINVSGQGTMLDDLGLNDAPEGISIWEGRYVVTQMDTYYEEEPDIQAQGKFRELTGAEWRALMFGENPLDVDSDVEVEIFFGEKKPLEHINLKLVADEEKVSADNG